MSTQTLTSVKIKATESKDFFGNRILSIYLDGILSCQFDWVDKGYQTGFTLVNQDNKEVNLGKNLSKLNAVGRFTQAYTQMGYNIFKK